MSGHNKWSQIRHQKAKTDAQKSKVFSKYAKLITVEAKKVMGNREAPVLKALIERARKENMPNENIERAVKKASEAGGAMMENITYEAYGPGGSALIIEVITDNRNKAAQEVKAILAKHGFALAGIGSVTWAFQKTHEGWIPSSTTPLSETDLSALQKMVDDLEGNDEVEVVYTNAE